jgi:hypothetical protein
VTDTSDPRMAVFSDEDWNEVLEIERQIAAEKAELLDEPKPEQKPEPKPRKSPSTTIPLSNQSGIRALWEEVNRQARQFSCSSLRSAGALGLIVLSHSDERPDSYLDPSFFDTMPSSPSWQICWNATSAGASIT